MIKQTYSEVLGADVVIARRKGVRHLRISIKNNGVVRLTVPFGVSERQAQSFLNSKADWITKHIKTPTLLKNGDRIGKSHRLIIQEADVEKVRTRIKTNEVVVTVPQNTDVNNPAIQNTVKKAGERALKVEAENLLGQRLQVLATKHDIYYRNVAVKKLKSRWGSCDNHKNIVLNYYLIQLDWELIDYVILHELAHTRHQHHQPEFWSFLETLLPDYKVKRKVLKTKPTDVFATNF